MDFSYLEGFAAGDRVVIGEVLALFVQQAEAWGPQIDTASADWRDVVHTIKGSARGIGANALGDLCAQAETAGPPDLEPVRVGLAAVVADIRTYLAR